MPLIAEKDPPSMSKSGDRANGPSPYARYRRAMPASRSGGELYFFLTGRPALGDGADLELAVFLAGPVVGTRWCP